MGDGAVPAIVAGVTSENLKPEQLAAMERTLARNAQYLSRLVERMQRLGFPNDDPLYARAMRARDATVALIEAAERTAEMNAKPAWMRAMGK